MTLDYGKLRKEYIAKKKELARQDRSMSTNKKIEDKRVVMMRQLEAQALK